MSQFWWILQVFPEAWNEDNLESSSRRTWSWLDDWNSGLVELSGLLDGSYIVLFN